MATYHLDPIVRIEGHLAAEVATNATYGYASGGSSGAVSGDVTDVKLKGEMFRGFENILVGRRPGDAIEITQRICGVCPVPHGLTATHAVENAVAGVAEGGEPNTVARLVRNLVLGSEFVMSHITHFYHLAALSYVQGPGTAPWTPYFDNTYYAPVLTKPYSGNEGLQGPARDVPNPARVAALTGATQATALTSIWDNVIIDYVEALKWRRKALEAGALFAGRMPMTRTFVAGGVTCRPTTGDIANFKSIIGSVDTANTLLNFIRYHYLPLTHIVSYLYEDFGGSETGKAYRKYGNAGNVTGGFGAGSTNFLAYGIFNLDNDGVTTGGYVNRLLDRGYAQANATGAVSGAVTPSMIGEYIVNSHYDQTGYTGSVHPSGGITNPIASASWASTYSWLKSPRLTIGGTPTPCQVGPLARMAVHGAYTNGVATSWETTATGSYTGNDKITAEEAGYKLGSTKTARITEHSTLGPLLVAQLVPVAGAFGTPPGTFTCGCSVMDRHRARAYECLKVGKALLKWAEELNAIIVANPTSYTNYTSWTMPSGTKYGVGMEEAPRGALGHWIKVKDGRIDNYQCIVPTTWNCNPCHDASSRTAATRGPVEQACVGTGASLVTLTGAKSNGAAVPVEVLRIVQSFDPCIACAVHVIEPEKGDLEGRCLE